MAFENDIATLRHARVFLTSREKINPIGLEQWDEMITRLTSTDELEKAFARSRAVSQDGAMFDRALAILHRMATERTGWKQFFSRWYYSDEPLRNDAANLVREARFDMMMPDDTRLVGS